MNERKRGNLPGFTIYSRCGVEKKGRKNSKFRTHTFYTWSWCHMSIHCFCPSPPTAFPLSIATVSILEGVWWVYQHVKSYTTVSQHMCDGGGKRNGKGRKSARQQSLRWDDEREKTAILWLWKFERRLKNRLIRP